MFWLKKAAPVHAMPGTWDEFMNKYNRLAEKCDKFIDIREIHLFVDGRGQSSITVKINSCEMNGRGANPMMALQDLANKSSAIAEAIGSAV